MSDTGRRWARSFISANLSTASYAAGCSRWFQRFAVWSHGAMKELQAKSKDGSAHLDTHVRARWEGPLLYLAGWPRWPRDCQGRDNGRRKLKHASVQVHSMGNRVLG